MTWGDPLSQQESRNSRIAAYANAFDMYKQLFRFDATRPVSASSTTNLIKNKHTNTKKTKKTTKTKTLWMCVAVAHGVLFACAVACVLFKTFVAPQRAKK